MRKTDVLREETVQQPRDKAGAPVEHFCGEEIHQEGGAGAYNR
jgi:hypothetical protein